jgi:hypothetical protein
VANLTRITDHVLRAILNLPPPLWGKPHTASVLRAICEEFQEIEDMFWDVMLLRAVDVAIGAQLQALGRLVGEPELGYSEATYRVLIKARIVINRGHGSIDDFIRVGAIITDGPTLASDANDVEPAFVRVSIDEAGGIEIAAVEKIVRETRAAGVRTELHINLGTTPGLHFGDASGTLVPSPAVGSFGDASGTVGEPIAGGPLWSITSV